MKIYLSLVFEANLVAIGLGLDPITQPERTRERSRERTIEKSRGCERARRPGQE